MILKGNLSQSQHVVVRWFSETIQLQIDIGYNAFLVMSFNTFCVLGTSQDSQNSHIC